MGMLSFIKDAGQKLFGIGEAQAASQEVAAAPTPENIQRMSDAASTAIMNYIHTMNLGITDLNITFNAPTAEVHISGVAPDQATKEKVLLCCGNVEGVASVVDNMTVAAPSDESKFYTVKSGDNLSKISKEFYDTPNKYMVIFEANKPMLGHPDKIYPGQLLRIPANA
jgi:nucleoid-associated protein YgaU